MNDKLKVTGMEMEESNVLFNYTSLTTQSTRSGVPWRGPHEKDPAFFQMVVGALTKPEDLVLYSFASINKLFLFICHCEFLRARHVPQFILKSILLLQGPPYKLVWILAAI